MPSNPFEAFDTPDNPEIQDHLTYLRQTQPWVIFLAVVTFLGAALCMLGALFMLAIGMGGFAMDGPGADLGAGVAMMAVLAGVYGAIALFYVLMGVLMIRMSSSMGQVAAGGGAPALGELLRHTRNFWRASGIIVLVFMVLYCGGIGVVSFMGAMAGTL